MWGLNELFENIKGKPEAKDLDEAISLATVSSYQSIALEEDRKTGKDYFTFLFDMLGKVVFGLGE